VVEDQWYFEIHWPYNWESLSTLDDDSWLMLTHLQQARLLELANFNWTHALNFPLHMEWWQIDILVQVLLQWCSNNIKLNYWDGDCRILQVALKDLRCTEEKID
jgi:hypothetical protein